MKKNKKNLVIGIVVAAVVIAALAIALVLGGKEPPTPTVPTTTQNDTQPTTQGTQPTESVPTAPTTVPTEPTTPTEPTEVPTTPTTVPTEPTEPPTIPTEPTEPPTVPTEPTEPPTIPTEPPHEHTYAEEVVEPTCTETGYTIHICDCGEMYTDKETPAKGHTYGEWSVTLEPTEEAEGRRERTCSICGFVEAGVIAKLPVSHKHAYTEEVTEATCLEGGYSTFTCSCGDTYRDKEVSPLGHSFGEYVSNKDAACLQDGTKTAQCQRCDVIDTVIDEGSALGHTYEETVYPPTCTEPGYSDFLCSCGDTYRGEETAATGHSFGPWETVVEPTEEAEGQKIRSCALCDYQEQEAIAKLPHTHRHTASVTAPTCLDGGYTTYTCSCGDTYTADETSALGHSFGDWEVTLYPTEATEGMEQRICTACGATEEQVVDKLPHNHGYVFTRVPATCTEQGYTLGTCACGYSYKEDYTAPLGHSYVASVTAPTCMNPGYTTHTCTACADAYVDTPTETIPHTYGNWVVAISPTCLSEGREDGNCTMCGLATSRTLDALGGMQSATFAIVTYQSALNVRSGPGAGYDKLGSLSAGDRVLVYGMAVTDVSSWARIQFGGHTNAWIRIDGYATLEEGFVPAGHSFGDWEDVTPATCTAGGSQIRTCANCTATETQDIAPAGHNWTQWQTGQVTSCESQITKTRSCRTCGAEESETFQGSHAYNTWTVTAAASCTNPGTKARTCVNCGQEQTEQIPMTDHAWTEWEITKPATTTEDGFKSRSCSICQQVETQRIPQIQDTHKHVWGETIVVAPTCTEKGYSLSICQICNFGADYQFNFTNELGHTWSDWDTTKKPAIGQVGYQQRTCATCGQTDVVAIPALDENGQEYEHYLDPRIEIVTAAFTSYDFIAEDGSSVSVVDFRTWGDPPSVWVLEDNSLRVVYFNLEGEMIEVIVEISPNWRYCRSCAIQEDGTYQIALIGGFG